MRTSNDTAAQNLSGQYTVAIFKFLEQNSFRDPGKAHTDKSKHALSFSGKRASFSIKTLGLGKHQTSLETQACL